MRIPSMKYVVWARSVEGKKLSGVTGLIFTLEFPDLQHPQRLKFIFSDSQNEMHFKCGKDGSTLELENSPLKESNLGEYGKETIMDLSDEKVFSDCLGKRLFELHLIYSSEEKAFIGIRFIFENELTLCIINLGDEMNMLKSLPSSFEKDEGIKYKKL